MQSKMQIAQVGPTTISPFLPPWENHFSPSKCSSSLTSSAPSNMTTTHQTLTNFVKSGAECKIKVNNPLPSNITAISMTSFIHWNFVQIAIKGKNKATALNQIKRNSLKIHKSAAILSGSGAYPQMWLCHKCFGHFANEFLAPNLQDVHLNEAPQKADNATFGCICSAFSQSDCSLALSYKSSGHWLMHASGSLFTQCCLVFAVNLSTKMVWTQWKYWDNKRRTNIDVFWILPWYRLTIYSGQCWAMR